MDSSWALNGLMMLVRKVAVRVFWWGNVVQYDPGFPTHTVCKQAKLHVSISLPAKCGAADRAAQQLFVVFDDYHSETSIFPFMSLAMGTLANNTNYE